MTWDLKAETLPGCLSVIARIAGVPVALRVAETYGGQARYIARPDGLRPTSWLSRSIGHKAAQLVAGEIGGERVQIPKARAERNALRVRQLWASGWSINAISREAKMGRTTIMAICRGLPRGPVTTTVQGDAPERCPVCGHRHRQARRAEAPPGQLALPLPPIREH